MTTDTIKRDRLRTSELSKFAQMFSEFQKNYPVYYGYSAPQSVVAAMSVFLLQTLGFR